MAQMKKITVKFPEKMESRLRSRAASKQVTVGHIVRELCGRGLRLASDDWQGAYVPRKVEKKSKGR